MALPNPPSFMKCLTPSGDPRHPQPEQPGQSLLISAVRKIQTLTGVKNIISQQRHHHSDLPDLSDLMELIIDAYSKYSVTVIAWSTIHNQYTTRISVMIRKMRMRRTALLVWVFLFFVNASAFWCWTCRCSNLNIRTSFCWHRSHP